MNNIKYTKADNCTDAIRHVSKSDDNKFIAGGTNIVDLMKYFISIPETVIDINHIPENKGIRETQDGGLWLGAATTNADTAYNEIIENRYPLLSKAILAGASAQIRNMATNGGNLLQSTRCYYFYDVNSPCNKREPGTGCSAIGGYNRNMAILGTSEACIAVFPSDMCIALAALEAVVHIKGPNGNRKLEFVNFHRLPGNTPHIDNNLKQNEIITGIELPEKGFEKNYSYLKLRDRNSYSFALVSVATGLDLDGDSIKEARIALGGVAHKPWRVKDAEEFLIGKSATRENFAVAAEIILMGAVPYEHNAFKIDLARRAIVRNCLMALNPKKTQLPGAQPAPVMQ